MKNTKTFIHLDFLLALALSHTNTKLRSNSLKKFYQITKKQQIRISQDIKRNVCFKCYEFLIPSVTAHSRMVKRSNGLFLQIKCYCGNVKNFGFKKQKGCKK